jgi:hypothetical protein
MRDDYCISSLNGRYEAIKPSFNNCDSLLKNDSLLSNCLSKNEILVANATGILPILKQLLINQKQLSVGSNLTGLDPRAKLRERTITSALVFDELISELNSETKRTKRAAGYLDGYEKKRINNLTIKAIFAGSATTVAPVFIKGSSLQSTIVISGAVASVYLGAKLLKSVRNKVEFTFDRNLLSDIWTEPQVSSQYPEFVWQLMNRPELTSAMINSPCKRTSRKDGSVCS